ncbi:ATP-binding protein [Nonomuraea sp. C10]|uniref:ATP-binding protein n=1 Tax=Nonomuraea sp. C10 TaxID=2600577 RepID=UPI0011CDB03F|nr:ATP-binding protein [Nonomuraea sp. C10]TXK34272.1 ATP-binding protein [Nonomuraea sp. C10]
MSTGQYTDRIKQTLDEAGIAISAIDERSFPGEMWFIVRVAEDALITAQSLAGAIERELNRAADTEHQSFVVTFRPAHEATETREQEKPRSILVSQKVDQLIQLLEARSRTSDALPSLKYVEDPRASLAAVGASRHHIVYGRRGVGKTALLLEAKRLAEKQGHVSVWMNAHTLRKLDHGSAFLVVAEAVLNSLVLHAGSSQGESFSRIKEANTRVTALRAADSHTDKQVGEIIADLNLALRAILREDLVRLYLFIDDFYLLPVGIQAQFLDNVAGMLRDCDAWLKLASIERLTRPFEPSSRIGLEIPHDASKIDLDVTLEEPEKAQQFLEAVLANYTTTAGINGPSSIARDTALGRLVLGSGGVPRDYLNLFASSIVAARSRPKAREVGKEDVADAAGRAARGKKRDLEQDVSSETAGTLLAALEVLSAQVKGAGYTYFRVDIAQKAHPFYEILAQLVDLRFAHLIHAALSDQHKPGVKYEVYMLDLSEFTDVRLKRGLHILDLEDGKWVYRQSGKAGTEKKLTGTLFRDQLRQSPIVDLEELSTIVPQRTRLF